jgi:hypothetical protein
MQNDITELAHSLKAAAEKAIAEEGSTWWNEEQLASDYGLALHRTDAKFIALASHENVLALVEALEKAQRASGYLREQSAEWERKAISNFEDCAEMSARVEELESQRKLAFAASNRWADKFREAEKRIAELESRTVKLPNQTEFDDPLSAYEAIQKCKEALTAAGIKVEAE